VARRARGRARPWTASDRTSDAGERHAGATDAARDATRDEARADVFDFIERFCNPTRRHSKPGYLSPVAFDEGAMRT
jgi:hypothetical protein